MVRDRTEVSDSPQTEDKVRPVQQNSGIVCPSCGGPTHVKNGKPRKGGVHNRYRKCDDCGTSFLTEEKMLYIVNIPK